MKRHLTSTSTFAGDIGAPAFQLGGTRRPDARPEARPYRGGASSPPVSSLPALGDTDDTTRNLRAAGRQQPSPNMPRSEGVPSKSVQCGRSCGWRQQTVHLYASCSGVGDRYATPEATTRGSSSSLQASETSVLPDGSPTLAKTTLLLARLERRPCMRATLAIFSCRPADLQSSAPVISWMRVYRSMNEAGVEEDIV
ncbi:hypothetical protein MTO96_008790 [Rhipicephalus appendiculatus]